MHARVCMLAHVCVYVCVHVYVCVCVCMCVCVFNHCVIIAYLCADIRKVLESPTILGAHSAEEVLSVRKDYGLK